MDDLKSMAMYSAIECIRKAKEKDCEVHRRRETPLSDVQKTTLRVEIDGFLDKAIDWIKAVIKSEEDED